MIQQRKKLDLIKLRHRKVSISRLRDCKMFSRLQLARSDDIIEHFDANLLPLIFSSLILMLDRITLTAPQGFIGSENESESKSIPMDIQI